MTHFCRSVFLLAALFPATGLSQSGDAYPGKPIMLILPQDAIGLDGEMQLMANSIREHTGIRIIMDKKPGAAGTIATAFVARANPDGYTILVQNSGFTITPFVYSNLTYDYARDLAPVTLLMKRAFIIVTHPAAPFRNAAEYVAYARSHPEELNFGTSGIGSSTHLPGALLHHMTNTKTTFIHYKKSAERLTDVMAGRIHAAAVTYATGMQSVRTGKFRSLGVTTDKRLSVAPDMPTIAEQGVKGYDYSSWTGILAPAGVQPAIINRLHGIWAQAVNDPEVAKKVGGGDGALMIGSSPAEFRQFIAAEAGRFEKLIKATGIKIQE
jgi:tripartite-type tricarboxylate transporter receptor subunit TctC